MNNKGTEQSEIYASARMQSGKDGKYSQKRKKVNLAIELIQSFKKPMVITDDIRVKAQSYFYAIHGINYYGRINPSEVTDDRVLSCINGIKQNINKTLLNFYYSYKGKIDNNCFQEIVNNAYEDLTEAYKLYCLVNEVENNPNISINELTSLVADIESEENKKQHHK